MTQQQTRTKGGRFSRAVAPEPVTIPAELVPTETPTAPATRTTPIAVTYAPPTQVRSQVRLSATRGAALGVAVSGASWAARLIAATAHGWVPAGARPLVQPKDVRGAPVWGAMPAPGDPVRTVDGLPSLDAYGAPNHTITAADAQALAAALERAEPPVAGDPFNRTPDAVLPLLRSGADISIG